MAYVVMAYIIMAYIVMAYIVMACIRARKRSGTDICIVDVGMCWAVLDAPNVPPTLHSPWLNPSEITITISLQHTRVGVKSKWSAGVVN